MIKKEWNRTDRKEINRIIICFLVFWLFFSWMISQTPYGIDDWSWGTSIGIEYFLTGSQNGRYIGNLFEIIVSRSPFLKVVLIGMLAALLPLLMVWVVRPNLFNQTLPEQKKSLMFFLLAVLFIFTIPRKVWRQTFGWIAGFSNFGFSAVLLLLFQKLLFRAWLPDQNCSRKMLFCSFLIAFCAELVLENVTVYIFAVTIGSTVLYFARNKRCNTLHLSLLFGVVAGAALMFTGSIYGSLFRTGHAIYGMRAITFDKNASLWSNLCVFYQRFVYFFPHCIWGDQWLICMMISGALAVKGFLCRKKSGCLIAVAQIIFAVYFVAVRFLGPIENYYVRWSDILTQRLNMLFFWIGLLEIVLLWKTNKSRRAFLLFLWISVPGVIVPLLATNMNADAGRCFLTSTVFLIEFCLAVIDDIAINWNKSVCRISGILLSGAVLLSTARSIAVYHEIGSVMRERATLIASIAEGERILFFPDFPHQNYLWVTEPVGEKQREFFREFYHIPQDVEMHFNTEEDVEYAETE